jgi:uncharacterized protein
MIRKGRRGGLIAALAAGAALLAGVADRAVAGPVPVSAALAHLHPESGLAIIPLTIRTAHHGERLFQVEVAATSAEQEHGLMFRKAMAPDEGMIFPMNPPRRTAFWMKNTVIGLDIIFIGADHRVLNIARNAVPYDETPLPSAGEAAGVLELNAGRAMQLGIEPGDLVRW